jgi:lipoyl(octanoyl) transferase
VRRYVRDLSEVMRRVVSEYGLGAGTIARYVGLWVDGASPAYWSGEELAEDPLKIGAIGVSISRWVTLHGFALNLCPELAAFAYIVPCGIREHGVSSVRELTAAEPRVRDAAERALFHLGEVFDARTSTLKDAARASWARLARSADDAASSSVAARD